MTSPKVPLGANPSSIPIYPLTHHDEVVPFAVRTMADIYDAADGHVDVPHRHHYYTVISVQEARGVHHIDFHDYEIKPHTIFFIHPEQVHQIEVKRKPQGVVMLFTCDFLMEHGISEDFIKNLNLFLSCAENPPITVPAESYDLLQRLTGNIIDEFKSNRPLKFEVIGAHLKLFLIECNRISDDSRPRHRPDFQNHNMLKEFKKLIEENFRSRHKVNDYSAKLFVTAKHLNEVIKTSIGRTAKEYIQDRIMLEAKRTAHFSDLSSKQIAYQLGYNDPAHFSKAFKKCQGVSFSDYRAQIRKKYN